MLPEREIVDEFSTFVADVEPRLKLALCANFGKDLGMEATAEALAFAWEHWDRVRETGNPAGYLYGVARNKLKGRMRRQQPVFPPSPSIGSCLGSNPVCPRRSLASRSGNEWR